MRVLAIGDTHLRATSRRNAARLAALDQILAAAESLRPDVIVWPGDLFDTRSTIEDRNTLRHYVKAFAAVASVVIVRGNHDAPGDLDIFGDLETEYPVDVVTRPQVVRAIADDGAVLRIACLPYPEEAGLAALGVAPPDVPDVAAAALDAIFMSFAGELDGPGPKLFIGHANVVGAIASTGQPLVGAEIALRPEHLDRLGYAVPKVLNHIHAPQEVHGATYVGSIAPMDWGEVERKRFLVLDYQPGPDGIWQVTSHPIELPSLYHVEGVLSRGGFEWVVKRGPDGDVVETPASWKGHEVRVRYKFQASDSALLTQAEAWVLAEFADAAHLEIEPVAVPDRAVRAPEVAAAQTTADKLRAYCALSGVEVSDGVLAKLASLETRESAEVLAALEQRLQAIAAQAESAVAA